MVDVEDLYSREDQEQDELQGLMEQLENKFARFIVPDHTTPRKKKTDVGYRYWFILSHDLPLSNMDTTDIHRLLLKFKSAQLTELMSRSDASHTFEDETEIAQADMQLFVRGLRGKDGRERELLASQIREFRGMRSNEQGQGPGTLQQLMARFKG